MFKVIQKKLAYIFFLEHVVVNISLISDYNYKPF